MRPSFSVPETSRDQESAFPMTAVRRPWWKWKRWWAAVVVWLLVAYPASLGPVFYLFGRGAISGEAAAGYSRVYALARPDSSPTDFDRRYISWAADVGLRHRPPPH